MTIKMPTAADYDRMKAIWQQAFGDPAECIDAFFETGFRPEHCRIAFDTQVQGAVYWFDFTWQEERYAFLYALAVDAARQGEGIGSALLKNLCQELKQHGYAGALLIPGSQSLYGYYEKLGFAAFGHCKVIQAVSGSTPIQLQEVMPEAYLQGAEGFCWDAAFAAFVKSQCILYRAGDIRLIRYRQLANIQEYIGPAEKLPGVLAALGLHSARVRMPGGGSPAGMCLQFKKDRILPDYLGPMLD